eukprot:scaffold3183_cov381-Prasinococcus_capsulatus_cf.AAC.10
MTSSRTSHISPALRYLRVEPSRRSVVEAKNCGVRVDLLCPRAVFQRCRAADHCARGPVGQLLPRPASAAASAAATRAYREVEAALEEGQGHRADALVEALIGGAGAVALDGAAAAALHAHLARHHTVAGGDALSVVPRGQHHATPRRVPPPPELLRLLDALAQPRLELCHQGVLLLVSRHLNRTPLLLATDLEALLHGVVYCENVPGRGAVRPTLAMMRPSFQVRPQHVPGSQSMRNDSLDLGDSYAVALGLAGCLAKQCTLPLGFVHLAMPALLGGLGVMCDAYQLLASGLQFLEGLCQRTLGDLYAAALQTAAGAAGRRPLPSCPERLRRAPPSLALGGAAYHTVALAKQRGPPLTSLEARRRGAAAGAHPEATRCGSACTSRRRGGLLWRAASGGSLPGRALRGQERTPQRGSREARSTGAMQVGAYLLGRPRPWSRQPPSGPPKHTPLVLRIGPGSAAVRACAAAQAVPRCSFGEFCSRWVGVELPPCETFQGSYCDP